MMLEPFTALLRFTFPAPTPIGECSENLKRFLETLAELCEKSGPCVIGHIKALALLSGDHYVRASVVSSSLPAQIDADASEDLTEMTLTLNMLVYGLPKKVLETVLKEAAAGHDTGGSYIVTVEPVACKHQGNYPEKHGAQWNRHKQK